MTLEADLAWAAGQVRCLGCGHKRCDHSELTTTWCLVCPCGAFFRRSRITVDPMLVTTELR